jgi:hypothetical protein
MDRGNVLYRLEFQDDGILYDEVELISAVELDPFVGDWQGDLPLKRDSSQVQLMAQAFLVGRLQQPRPQGTVDLDGGPDDLLRELL